MPVTLRLLHGVRHGDDDIPKHLRTGVLIDVVYAVLPEREGENVCAAVYIAVLLIQFMDFVVVNKFDADLCRTLEFFKNQHCRAAAAHQHAYPCGNFHFLLRIGNNHFYFIFGHFCVCPPHVFRML